MKTMKKIGWYLDDEYTDWNKVRKMKWSRRQIKMSNLETVLSKKTSTYKYDSNLGRVDLSPEDYREKLVRDVCSIGKDKLYPIEKFLEGYEQGTLLSAYTAPEVGSYGSRWNVKWLAVATESKTMYDKFARLRGIASTYRREQFFLDVNEIPKALELIDEAKGKMGSYEDDKAYEESLLALEKAYDSLKEDAKRDGWYDMTPKEIAPHMEQNIRGILFQGDNMRSSFRTFSTGPYTYLLVDDGDQGRVKTYDEYLEDNPLMTDFHPRISRELIRKYEEMHTAKYHRRYNYAQRWLKVCRHLVALTKSPSALF
mgnify:CR=1 FL=1